MLTGPSCPSNLQSITQSFLATVRRTPTNLALSSPSQPSNLYGFTSQPLKRRQEIHQHGSKDTSVQQIDNHDAVDNPNETCELDPEYEQRPWLRWTYGTLYDAVDLFSSAITQRGAMPGAPVLTLLHNGIESWICLWASHLNRHTWAPLHPGNLRNTPEMTYMMQTVLDDCSSPTDEDGTGAVVVVVVDNTEIAAGVDATLGAVLGGRSAVKIIAGDDDDGDIQCIARRENGWMSMGALLNDERARRASHLVTGEAKPGPSRDIKGFAEDRLILFTSGSTAMPKGCVWEHPQTATRVPNLMTDYAQSTSSSQGADARMYCPMPNNHAAAYICPMPWIVHGGAIVLPSRQRRAEKSSSTPSSASSSINPEAMLRDIGLESCTDFLTVPTMVAALVAANETVRADLSSTSISLAGASSTESHLQSCFDGLGVARMINYWGMTECVNLWPAVISRSEYDEYRRSRKGRDKGQAIRNTWFLRNDVDISIGTIAPSQSIKVCKHESTDAVPLSKPGELHISSASLIPRYIGAQASNSDFYNGEDGMRWFNTGDEAVINEAGQVFLTGRHKEVIVRGGENISPVAMEDAIARNPELKRLELIVVGAPDEIAGHVPVVVVKQPSLVIDTHTMELLHQTILDEMGPIYVPSAVLALGALGLVDWPKTTIGKLQRGKVGSQVEAFLKRKRASSTQDVLVHEGAEPKSKLPSPDLLGEMLTRVWAEAIGIANPDKLPVDKPIRLFSDSITLMRVRAGVLRETGVALSLAEMAEADTIKSLLDILLARKLAAPSLPPTPDSGESVDNDGRENSEATMEREKLVVNDDQKRALSTSLRGYGLAWEDCESLVVPADMNEILSRYAAFNGWAASFVLTFPEHVDVGAVEDALKRLFEAHPMLLSHYARTSSSEAFHVLLRHEPHVLKNFIKVRRGPGIKSAADLRAVPRVYSAFQGPASVPGLVTHAEIFEVQGPEACTGLVLTVNHVVMDATYCQMVLSDLEAILSGNNNTLGQYIDYEVWSRAYHSRRASPQAEAVSDWHVAQLRDLHLYESSIWPLHRAEHGQHQDTFQHNFDLSKIATFREAHPEIQPCTVFKAAMILATAATTSQKHVAFSSCEAARSHMPFTPRPSPTTASTTTPGSRSSSLTSITTEEAIDVAGPTYSIVFELTSLTDDSKVSQVLQQLEQRQQELTMNATACWRDIHARLAGEEDNKISGVNAQALEKLTFALAFNWVPPDAPATGATNRRVQLLETYFPSVGGLEVLCGLNGPPDQQSASLQLSGTGLDVDGMRRFALKMETALDLLVRHKEQDCDALLVSDVLAVLTLPGEDPVAAVVELADPKAAPNGAGNILERPRALGRGAKRMAV